jgi:lactate dehydrogenase-like 2-hydroxyacid dehydrogenase
VEAKRRGIAVTTGGGHNAGDVADLAVLLTLALVRDLPAHDKFVRTGAWIEGPPRLGRSMAAQRVGIVGLGHIGTAVARRLAPTGCEIAWWGPNAGPDAEWPRRESLEGLARWASVLIVAARADEGSRRLVSAEVIEALGSDGFLVNVSRGFVLDEAAVRAALRAGRLGGAALDVFESEPASGREWLDIPNVLLTPHVGGATARSVEAVIASAVDNVRRHFRGEALLNRVA